MKTPGTNAALLVAGGVASLIILEVLLRAFHPVTLEVAGYNPEKHYFAHEPDSKITYYDPNFFTKEYAFPYTRNSKGFSDREHSYANTANKVRIVSVGDSFTEGLAAAQDKTFMALLEKTLNSHSDKYEVINLGMEGMDPDNYYFTFKNEGAHYGPRHLIMGLFIGNDLRPSMQLLREQDGKLVETYPTEEASAFFRVRKWFSARSEAYVFFVYLLLRNEFTHELLHRLGIFAPTHVDFYDTQDHASFEAGLKNAEFVIEKTDELARADGTKTLVVLIPTKEQVDDARYRSYSKRIVEFNGRFEAQESLMAFCKEKKIDCLDLLPAFRGKNVSNTFYFDTDGHWNAAGHELAADLIYERLLSSGESF